MIHIAEARIKKVRRKDSHIYGIKQLRQSVKYIVETYCQKWSESCINISSLHRMTLANNYMELNKMDVNKDENAQTTEIVDQNLDMFTGARINVNEEEKALMGKYLLLFDEAIDEIVGLLKLDSLSRFYRSSEYQRIIGITN